MRLYIILLICIACLNGNLSAQHTRPTKQEKQRIHQVSKFCRYVKKKPLAEIDQDLLFEKYLSFEYILTDTTKEQIASKVFSKLLKDIHTVLDTTHINSYGVVPWNKYQYKENLPRMLWEDEPLTGLFGNPLPDKTASYRQAVIEGKKELENIMVCFKKKKPQEPLYYFLFDEQNKIVSWLLIRQGGLHYFLTF
jgi:hypothetical protein